MASLFQIGRGAHRLPLLSVEFFPPKDETAATQLIRTASSVQDYAPDFVSITYGAGGTTRARTLDYTQKLATEFGFRVMPHLTCVGHTREELIEIIEAIKATGARQIMALRGDPPKGADGFEQHPGGLRYASELVALIREVFPECTIGVAGYPEKHPESTDAQSDLFHLKEKVDAGADFITTQLFFDNRLYFRFVENCVERGITVPVLPGLMSILSRTQAERFCTLCGASIPAALTEALDAAGNDAAAVEAVGLGWTREQMEELIAREVPGIHLYILNRAAPMRRLLDDLAQRRNCAAFVGAKATKVSAN